MASLAAGLLVVLFVAGLTFANSIGASRVAANAAALHWANSASGVSALTRAALAQAVTFSELQSRGLAGLSDLEFALEQVEMATDELAVLEQAGIEGASLAALTQFRASAVRAGDALSTFDTSSAMDEMERLEQVYLDLATELRLEQDAIQVAIAAHTDAAARVNGYLVFVLTLAIPGAAVIVYWLIARRQMKEHLARSEVEIEAERAVGRAKDSFIAGLSHELRTPLTSVYGFAEILADGEAEDPEQVRELAEIIANESSELTRMVDDLLAASRLDSTGIEIEMSPTRVSSAIESALAPFRRAGAEVRWDSSDALVMTDVARLRHILVNLVSNAVRHGGPDIGIEVSAAESTVEIEVWDTGKGVPEDRADNLYDRFAHAGTSPLLTGSVGLGLAVASSLAARLEGSLRYQRFGGKTYFVVTLPAYLVGDIDHGDEAAGDGEMAQPPETESVSDMIRALSP